MLEVSLFNKNCEFLGRTYNSFRHPLSRNAGLYDTNVSEYVMFHTWLPIDTLEIIVELFIYDPSRHYDQPISAGWARLGEIQEYQPASVQIREGIPRQIIQAKTERINTYNKE